MKRIISLTLICALVLSVCACGTTGSAETDTETVPIETAIDESVEVETSETSESAMETEIDDDIDSFFTVETLLATNELLNSGVPQYDYELICNDVTYDQALMIGYGFDNDYSINRLREIILERTGEQNDLVTLSDVDYFQGVEWLSTGVSHSKFSEIFSVQSIYGISPYDLAYVRAILQINGWRFAVDEIPYDYFVQRFPSFMESICATGELPSVMQDPQNESCMRQNDPFSYTNMYDRDYEMFIALYMYNVMRLSYIYNNPYGNTNDLTDDVLQVRDAETGRNVLVPTEEQYYQMMEDITSIPGCENVDIRFVETRENFYEAYGYYPEDIINDTMIYEGNISN